MRRPDFIGIGAHKAGTTWIYHCLYEHPQIYASVKEIRFFDEESRWGKGCQWYESFFKNCPPGNKTGEFSTSYLASEIAPFRIYQKYPQVKLIISLRQPVQRAFSHYLHDLRLGLLPADTLFEEAIKWRPEYLRESCYAQLLKNYLKFFKKEQILFLVYEDINKDPLRFIQTIYQFIGVEPSFIPSVLWQRFNEDRVPRFPTLERWLLIISYKIQFWGWHRWWWRLKKLGLEKAVALINTKKYSLSMLNQLTLEKLKVYFKDDIRELEEIIGRKLTEWYV